MAKLVFLHVPKAAGTSLNSMLARSFGPRFRILTCDEGVMLSRGYSLGAFRRTFAKSVFSGHVSYGVHLGIPGDVVYATFLRSPVSRIASHYHYVKENPTHYLYDRLMSANMSLVDYAESRLSLELDNGQVRILSGYSGAAPVEEKHLRLALANAERFLLVGFQEFFYEGVVELFRRLKKKAPPIVRRNLTNSYAAVTDGEAHAISSMNSFDEKLFNELLRRSDYLPRQS